MGERPVTEAELLQRLTEIHGWLLVESAINILRIVEMTPPGDILEIGSYCGRSTALLLWCLGTTGRLFVSDLFAAPAEAEGYWPESDKPSVSQYFKDNPPCNQEQLLETLRQFGDTSRVVLIPGPSSDLGTVIPENWRFSFVHIDGCHSRKATFDDMVFAARHMAPGGVMAVDDWQHPNWPEVWKAIRDFQEFMPNWKFHSCDPGKAYLRR